MDERDLADLYSQLPSPIRGAIEDQIRKRMPPISLNPLGGLDNAPVPPPAPVIPVAPWTFHFGTNQATVNLPANQGANFEGYLNYNFNPFSPGSMGINGGGLRYRYQF